MIALVTIETALLLILSVLVAGLLRGYATVLRRLHQLDGGAQPAAAPPFRTISAIPEPTGQRIEGRDEWAPAHDIDGISLRGEISSVRTVGVEHDTIIAFLSSSCEGCTGFWHELAAPNGSWAAPGGARLLVVTKGADEESPAALSKLCPPGVDLLMSSQAWAEFEVPGSPYVVVTDGQTGRIKGEGSGTSFSQVGGLIQQSVDDRDHPVLPTGVAATKQVVKPVADREREQDVDRVLLRAGITPGDPSLYIPSDAPEQVESSR